MKKLIIPFSILLTIIIWFTYTKLIVKFTINNNDHAIVAVEVHTAGAKGIYTEDRSKISEIISHLNSIRYYKWNNLKIYNTSPDAYIALFDKDGKIIDEVEYFANVVEYKNSKYGMLPFTYSGLEKLCDKLNKK